MQITFLPNIFRILSFINPKIRFSLTQRWWYTCSLGHPLCGKILGNDRKIDRSIIERQNKDGITRRQRGCPKLQVSQDGCSNISIGWFLLF